MDNIVNKMIILNGLQLLLFAIILVLVCTVVVVSLPVILLIILLWILLINSNGKTEPFTFNIDLRDETPTERIEDDALTDGPGTPKYSLTGEPLCVRPLWDCRKDCYGRCYNSNL